MALPKNGYFIDSLGWAYFQQGRFREAVAELERAAELLQTPPLDLRTRFFRLEVPLRGETAGVEEEGDEPVAAWLAEG